IVSLLILPMLAHVFFGFKIKNQRYKLLGNGLLLILGVGALIYGYTWAGIMLLLFGIISFAKLYVEKEAIEIPKRIRPIYNQLEIILAIGGVVWLLATYWLPLGASRSLFFNVLFVAILVSLILGAFTLLEYNYKRVLTWCLDHKAIFLTIPAVLILFGATVWLGFNTTFGLIPKTTNLVGWDIQSSKPWSSLTHTFPGMQKEFMPSLNEGSFLLMPTAMPHSGI